MFGVSRRSAFAVLAAVVILLAAMPVGAQGGWYTASVDGQIVAFTKGFGIQICGESKPRAWSPDDPAGVHDFKPTHTGSYYRYDNLELQDYGASNAFAGWARMGPSTNHSQISGCPPSAPSAPPPPPPAKPQVSFTADQTNLSQGQCTTLHWNIPDGWSLVNILGVQWAAQGIGSNSGGAIQDSQQVCPSSTTTYKIDANFPSGTQSKSITISVSGPPPPPPQQPPQPQIAPAPPPVQDSTSGAAVDLNGYCAYKYGNGASASMGNRWDAWSWSCSTSGNQSFSIDMSDVCAVEHPDFPNAVMLDGSDAYSWVCRAASSQPVPSQPSPSLNFAADRYTIKTGECVTLQWTSANVDSVVLNGSTVDSNGTQPTCPKTTTSYYLLANSSQGPLYQQVTVSVASAQSYPAKEIRLSMQAGTRFTGVKIIGENQNGVLTTWQAPPAPSDGYVFVDTSGYWWQSTIVITIDTPAGQVGCAIDYLDTSGSDDYVPVVFSDHGCSGDNGSGDGYNNTFQKLYQAMQLQDAYGISQAVSGASDKVQCAIDIANGVKSPLAVFKVGQDCGNVALDKFNEINDILGKYGKQMQTSQ